MNVAEQKPRTASAEADLVLAAGQLRTTLSDAIASKGLRLDEPLGIARGLALDKTMGWKLSRVTQSSDPIEAALHVPGNEGLGLVVTALERAGVASRLREQFGSAVDSWRATVDKHAGDRTTLQLMLAGIYGRREPSSLEKQRKLLYQGARSFWGVHTDAIIRTDFYGPAADPDLLDVVGVRCLAGFQRLRPVHWVLSNVYVIDDNENAPQNRLKPLDPEIGPSEAPLLRSFCSEPTPVVQRMQAADGFLQDILAGEQFGKTSRLDCVMGEVYSGIRRVTQPGQKGIVSWQRIRTPAECLNFDLVVHRSIPHLDELNVKMRSELETDILRPVGPDHPCWMPVYDPMVDHGDGLGWPTVPEYPRYNALLDHVFECQGWDPQEFRLFRLRMKYPPIVTAVRVAWPLPVDS